LPLKKVQQKRKVTEAENEKIRITRFPQPDDAQAQKVQSKLKDSNTDSDLLFLKHPNHHREMHFAHKLERLKD
jgi:hypothetical protein